MIDKSLACWCPCNGCGSHHDLKLIPHTSNQYYCKKCYPDALSRTYAYRPKTETSRSYESISSEASRNWDKTTSTFEEISSIAKSFKIF